MSLRTQHERPPAQDQGAARDSAEDLSFAPVTHASCEEFGLRRHARKWKSRGSILKENVPRFTPRFTPVYLTRTHGEMTCQNRLAGAQLRLCHWHPWPLSCQAWYPKSADATVWLPRPY